MKKKYLKYGLVGFVAISLSACDFLDCNESEFYSEEDIITNYERTRNLATHVYSYLPDEFCNLDGAMQEAGTDNAVHVYATSDVQRFVDGSWSPNRTIDDVWGHYYQGIRAANLYLKEADGLTFDDWKENQNYEDWMKMFEYYQYEVRFLRAYFYFELIKRYQNVPLLTTVLTINEVNTLKPSSFSEIAQFILDECEVLKAKLPINYKDGYPTKETGRITRGAVMALASRLTLYMASPLYNSTEDKAKWKQAATASYELIGQATTLGYDLVAYSSLFDEGNNVAKENILVRPIGENGDFEKNNFPMGVTGGKTSTCPTENLVSAYEMTNGEPFDWSNPVMKADPYKDRDPRLAMTVAYNGMQWPAKNTLEIWEGGANGLPLNNATVTGYYLKKYVNNDISFEVGSTVTKKHHNWILFRYGEVLLNYAEAMANAFDSPTYKDADFPMSALEAVNKLRNRSDVQMPPYPTDITKDDFIKRLKNERRVELAFEGHRFWDIRRWKDLDQTTDVYGVRVTKDNAGSMVYEKQLYGKHVVDDRMYFYPISNAELFKNENLKQNPGW